MTTSDFIKLADKYETSSFYEADPSQFLKWYSDIKNIEIASFFTAMLSFGNRNQFIPKIKQVLQTADKTSGNFANWVLNSAKNFPKGSKKFYRFYSFDDLHIFFDEISKILQKNETFGQYLQKIYEKNKNLQLAEIISQSFQNSKIVPKGKNSANKRINMFLRWMVRTNSPVDLGLWTWYNPKDLIIPLDVHVLQEAINFGFLPKNAKPTKKTAEELTKKMNYFFPNDPVRADFALFGLGIDFMSNTSEKS